MHIFYLTIYYTSACHLCELAEELVGSTLSADSYQLQKIDIADDESLLERYGARIPVLRQVGCEKELDWPFSREELLAYCEND